MESNDKTPPRLTRRNYSNIFRPIFGVLVVGYILWRIYQVLIVQQITAPEIWVRLLISGLIIGAVYALIAIGFSLVYGILFMINFAHGEVMMIGTFAGYFLLEITNSINVAAAGNPPLSFSDAYPLISVILAFLVGMSVSAMSGYFLEKIAYRPLRKAPRLIPLISAIGASFFLQNAAQLMFSPVVRDNANPQAITRGAGWSMMINDSRVVITYTGVLTFVLSIVLMIGLYTIVKKTKLGKAMRAVAFDKNTAALMGIDVDAIISRTFIISGALAGAAGVMWGLHNGIVHFFVGFLPGVKAFTAAVLGGIGNIPGAMLGGMFLGLVESLGPQALGMSFQLKDVIAFVIMIVILVFRPSGILGEVLSEEKV